MVELWLMERFKTYTQCDIDLARQRKVHEEDLEVHNDIPVA